MNSTIAKKRISLIGSVDAVNTEQCDFLATHVPFSSIEIKNGSNSFLSKTKLSEDKLFELYFNSDKMYDKHQLIIVEGSSGAGKSHFIRWLYAKMKRVVLSDEKEVVLLIRRSDNTLKGTIKQLIEIDEVKNIKNKDVYRRLLNANTTITEQKFKLEIYHKFLVEIENDTDSEKISNRSRKGLCALLSNEDFRELMFSSTGPIERIYNKIHRSEIGSNQDTVAQFTIEDFTLNEDFVTKIDRKGADSKATRMANKLIPSDDDERENVTYYLNSYLETVIQSCAGIEPGDFQQIFKEIRQELKKQGKNLTLLIEDITAFTGINQALLNALVTEHTGLNESDDLCRLRSVVGITSGYYDKNFRDNYKDRITSEITISDGILGNNYDDLILFVAKYLNAISLDLNTLKEWENNGAKSEDFPVHQSLESEIWDYYNYNGKKINLYPFTKSAIINLYNAMEGHPTPRYILREIIEPAVNEILFKPESFPSCFKNKHNQLKDSVESRIRSIVSSMSISLDEKNAMLDRVLPLISFWGDKTIDATSNAIGKINRKIFKELNLNIFENSIQADSADITPVEETSDIDEINYLDDVQASSHVDPATKKANDNYNLFKEQVYTWLNEDKPLVNFQEIRDAICDFVFQSINWQQEGIPFVVAKKIVDYKTSGKNIVFFARQAQGENKGIIELESNQESAELLLCFARWRYMGNKSWNYAEATNDIYTATFWLYKYKSKIIEATKGMSQKNYPEHIEFAIIYDLYRKILNGEIKCLKAKDIKQDFILMPFNTKKHQFEGHCSEWDDLLSYIYNGEQSEKINTYILQYFNLIQGTTINASKYVLNFTLFNKVFKSIKSNNFNCTAELNDFDKMFKYKIDIEKEYTKLTEKVHIVAKAEISKASELIQNILIYFGYDEDDEINSDDIKSLLNDIRAFYNDALKIGGNISNKTNKISEILKQANEIERALKTISVDYDDKNDMEIIMAFSSDPIGTVLSFYHLLKEVSDDLDTITKQMTIEIDQLTRKGNWNNDVDPRFSEEIDGFNKLYQELKGEE